ncbi:MAG: hypothetical protein IJN58_04730, partial [Clostridia bacterium]|nr:hypothetical protein [Clostridia bacterium]
MKRNLLIALLLVLAMALFGFGCSPAAESEIESSPESESESAEPVVLSADQVAKAMENALAATPCTMLEMVTDLSMTLDDTVTTAMKSTSQTTVSQEPVSVYVTARTDTSIMDQITSSQSENYVIAEDGKMVSYLNSDGVWLKVPSEQDPEDYLDSNASVAVNHANLALDNTVTQWNGQEVICLKTQFTGDSVKKALSGQLDQFFENIAASGESTDGIAAMDDSKLSCDATLYLDPVSYLPLGEELQIVGLTETMAPLYTGAEFTIDVTDCRSLITYLSYEPQPAVTLPEGTVEKVDAWTRLLAG